jgi:hypothetical protein
MLPPVETELLDGQGETRNDQLAKEVLLGGQQPHLLKEVQQLHHKIAGSDGGVGPAPPACPLLAFHVGPFEEPHEARRRIGRLALGPSPNILHKSTKEGWSPQDFSYRKTYDTGVVDEAVTRRGTWSKVGRSRECRVVLKSAAPQAALMKAQSRRTSVGTSACRPSEASVQERQLLEEELVDGVREERRAGRVEAVGVLVLGGSGDVEVAKHQPGPRAKGSQFSQLDKERGV